MALALVVTTACGATVSPAPTATSSNTGLPLAIDTHVDTPQRMVDRGDDIGVRLVGGHLDLPRMREGGLGGAFFSLWVDPEKYQGDAAWERTKAMAYAVRAVAERYPEGAALCTTGNEVRGAVASGRVALLMGVEGAHAFGTDDPDLLMARLEEIFDLGARYLTITWSVDNPLGHSSSGEHPELGLTDLGRVAIRRMNRMGMIVDVSHVSDRTFSDIMEVTTRPVLASHSSARALADHPRNMTDAMIRRVSEGGGAVCVNYYSQFIDAGYRARRTAVEEEHAAAFAAIDEAHPDWMEASIAKNEKAMEFDPELKPPDLNVLVDHFVHIAGLVGDAGVCLGSDFDGVSELPTGLGDVADLPKLRKKLEAKGLDTGAIFGTNVIRILDAQDAKHPPG
ncbi:MAG: dipeptidase [Myxococcales bacterium]|nr:dipeptidase [Myxococcales bacterium]